MQTPTSQHEGMHVDHRIRRIRRQGQLTLGPQICGELDTHRRISGQRIAVGAKEEVGAGGVVVAPVGLGRGVLGGVAQRQRLVRLEQTRREGEGRVQALLALQAILGRLAVEAVGGVELLPVRMLDGFAGPRRDLPQARGRLLAQRRGLPAQVGGVLVEPRSLGDQGKRVLALAYALEPVTDLDGQRAGALKPLRRVSPQRVVADVDQRLRQGVFRHDLLEREHLAERPRQQR